MEPLLTRLRAIAPLSPSLEEALVNGLKREVLPKKTQLLLPGNVADRLYFIEKGVVRGYYLHDDRDVTSWFMKEGDFVISIVSFITRRPSEEAIELLEDGVVWSIRHGPLQRLYAEFPEFNAVGRVLTEAYYVRSELRTHGLRWHSAEQRYRALREEFPEIFNRVPLRHIASHLGISAETLSRLRAKKD